MAFKQKIYLQAHPHPTAGLVFNQWKDIEGWIRGYWAGGKQGKLILQKLIEQHWEAEGKDIYKKYNLWLLAVTEGFGWNNMGSLVLYIPKDLEK